MSLIISMKTPDCIVVASDSCMTITTSKSGNPPQVTAMSYTHHAAKMVVFRERLVVTYCGDMFVTDTMSVLQFLRDLKVRVPRNITPKQLARRILAEYKEKSNRSTTFHVSGYDGFCGAIWHICTSTSEIKECFSEDGFGASCSGKIEFVGPMLSAVSNYTNLSAKDAVDLVSHIMECMSCLYQFLDSQCVGGDIDVYLMYRDKSLKSGWIQAGQSIPVYPYGYKKGDLPNDNH